jgi:thiamine-phosphate pyrophosphorylase
MGVAHQLARIADRLNRDAGAPALPSLYFFTDPVRTPEPERIAKGLPSGSAVVFRHFSATDRARRARRLAAICRQRGLTLLIAADPELAESAGADGVHWPERRLPAERTMPNMIETSSAHGPGGLAKADALGLDACFLGPVFPTRSKSGNPPLGLFRATQLARASVLPVIALGGIDQYSARPLVGRGFAGIAAVDALIPQGSEPER